MRSAAAVGGTEPRHNHLRSRRIHDGLMRLAFGETIADVDQNLFQRSNGGEKIDVPVPFLSPPKVAAKPMGQPPPGAAGIDVVAGRKDLSVQGSDPNLNLPRKTEQEVVEAAFFILAIGLKLSIQSLPWMGLKNIGRKLNGLPECQHDSNRIS